MSFFTAIIACAFATEEPEKDKDDAADPAQNKDKRQTQDEIVHGHLIYREARKQVGVKSGGITH